MTLPTIETDVNPNAFVAMHPECGFRHDLRVPCLSELPERFAVEVTVWDILYGQPCSADNCPIAVALGRWLRAHGIPHVALTVTARDIEVNLHWGPGGTVRYWFDAHTWVDRFDHGEQVQPRTVVLARMPR